ncbi:Ig-like domain-containing protein [Pseudomonas sp. B21-041]|uniref:Ig-like domain-containing protein n=1 Tax=Pseudomonas sp. B21-041 TaxID=2895487 RepID=UPI002160D148|nr:Ig-like domain-containing protein [Pseudomonas sp. B21-041]UVL36355.1 Ig-like domain-containing protein [Pseudomonas sp. B21-041]
MIGLMVMPIEDDIDDTQHDITPFDSNGGMGLFSLFPANIPGQFTGIDFPPAQVGANRPMLYTSANGLRVLVQAYLNMAEGDTIRLYVGENLVDTSVLPADHGNLDVVMHIAAKLVPAGVHTLRYEILRKSGQPPEGAQIEVWFKIDPPGGNDPEPDLPGHQRLKPARLQLKPGQVIDEEVAAEGVTAVIPPWPFMTKGDKLKLCFHGIAVTPYTVLESEVGKEISVFISPENIRDAGPANPAVVVYQIEDQVENVSDFSERTTVISDPDKNWLDPVFVPLADEDLVSLDEVGFDDLEVQIITRTGFVKGQKLRLQWTATAQSGEVVEHNEEQSITRIGIQSFKIPNPIVLASASGQVQVDYRRIKDEGEPDRSEIYIFTLQGKTLRLPAPWMTDLVGGTLDPALSQTVVLCGPDDRIKKGFRVTLTWMGTSASGRPHLYQTYRDVSDRLVGQAIAFNVTGNNIAPLIRGSVGVSYEVSHATLNPALVSEKLYARVDDFKPVLPAPVVISAIDGVLNPAHVPYGTDIQVAAASYTRLGDVVHVEGRGDAGGVVFRDKLPIDQTRADKDLEFWLDGEAIKFYREQFFSVLWWIERPDELPQSSALLELYIGDPAQSLQPPTVRRAPDGVLDPLENNDGARARVHVASPRPGDQVRLLVKGAPGEGSPTFAPLPLNADNVAFFVLRPSFIAENLGKLVEVLYELIRNGKTIQSRPLMLTVKTISDGDPVLTRPHIVEAGAVPLIDLRIIQTDLTCVVKPPLPIAEVGQRVWIMVSSEGVEPLVLRPGTALTAEEVTQGISVKAARSWFYSLKDLSGCALTCKIALKSTDDEDTALVLPVARYTVKVTEKLAIDTQTMLLNGWKLLGGTAYGLREREVVNNVQVRVPTGGRPPYTYRSANAGIASVDANGKVSGLSNQSTTITVTDADENQVSYPVRVMNVYRLILNNTFMTAAEAGAWFRQFGAVSMDNSGQPMGWGILHNNFVDVTPIYGGRGLYYGRFVSVNLSYPHLYAIEHSLLVSNGAMGSRNVFLSDGATRSRAMGYFPT